jgi:hypothetical protein
MNDSVVVIIPSTPSPVLSVRLILSIASELTTASQTRISVCEITMEGMV